MVEILVRIVNSTQTTMYHSVFLLDQLYIYLYHLFHQVLVPSCGRYIDVLYWRESACESGVSRQQLNIYALPGRVPTNGVHLLITYNKTTLQT